MNNEQWIMNNETMNNEVHNSTTRLPDYPDYLTTRLPDYLTIRLPDYLGPAPFLKFLFRESKIMPEFVDDRFAKLRFEFNFRAGG